MDKARLLEILNREEKKLVEGGVDWLSEYGSNAKRDVGFTFYMICRILAQSTQNKLLSSELQKHITNYMVTNGVRFAKKWNPVDWFTSKWTARETRRAEIAASSNPETDFNLGYADIISRDKQKVWRMWLARQYEADVLGFFGQDTEGSTLHEEAQSVKEDSALTALGRGLFWEPPEMMEEVDQLLKDKPQLILYGPPGTGKTYVARALAKHLMGGEEPTFLQFHPSYSYEDFFEGYRPVSSGNGGMPQFKLIPGPLKELAERAGQHPEPHVLVIDEINRGNLAKIFGELYFLLEYRDEEIMLQYGGQPFSLPKNLHIIGTMNTADRSISHIDAALRRRFHFFPLFPDKQPIRGSLTRYLAKKHTDKRLEWIAQVVDLANEKLDGRDGLIGHSYFMPENAGDFSESWVRRVWEYSIMPLIEDRLIDQPDKMKEFALDNLWSALREGLPLENA